MKNWKILLIICGIVLLTGCSSSVLSDSEQQETADNPARISLGESISIDAPEQLTFLESNDILAADGLYYAAWVDGDSVPYQNSDEETVDLYDAQLYFLASETATPSAAEENLDAWLSAAQENYEVYSTEDLVCNEQTYTVISYSCTADTTPYDRGVSAFGVCGTTAVCAEFTCLEDYDQELEPILIDFLNNCRYDAD